MSLKHVVEQYGAFTASMRAFEAACEDLQRMRTGYQELAGEFHRALQAKVSISLPVPEGVRSEPAYCAYQERLRALIQPTLVRRAGGTIRKGDLVQIVRARPRYGRKERYYFGTPLERIPPGTRGTILQVKQITTRYDTDSWSSEARESETGYLLDTKRILGRNAAFHRSEITKVQPDAPSLEEFVQRCLADAGVTRDGLQARVVATVQQHAAKLPSDSLRNALYTLASTLFPEYKATLRQARAS